ncbi:MAG TPA: NUDIX domain-containing protein, partial [Streptosporangiaceae bacterium]
MPDSAGDGVIRAAGAVVWRPGTLGPEIALVHRPRYDDWSYPKGKCRRDEHVLTAAIREVTEETGLRVILGRPLSASVYQANGKPKRVRYWAARCVESVGFTPNHEVDQVTWFPADAARSRLTYPRDVTLLDEFRSGPARSVPFIVLRHATAGRKSARGSADPRDLARPLDAKGKADAELLAGLLASFGQCRV